MVEHIFLAIDRHRDLKIAKRPNKINVVERNQAVVRRIDDKKILDGDIRGA
jgi:hypothetical protein